MGLAELFSRITGDKDEVASLKEQVADLTLAVADLNLIVTNLMAVINSHQEAIEQIAPMVQTDGSAIKDLNDVAAFMIQNQQAIAAHIGFTENMQRGKILPSTFVTSSDGDFSN